MRVLQPKVLLLYKKSAYSIYFHDWKIHLIGHKKRNFHNEIHRFKKAHDEHFMALKTVERILRQYNIGYKKYARGQNIPYEHYGLVITVGGDGTFLEAARNIKGQLILGVNSAPRSSVGKLCTATTKNFEKLIKGIVSNDIRVDSWQRLRLELGSHNRRVECLNDILICHSNPAAVSRYYLKIGRSKEEQRSSGVWIATPAGSSGAIHSAGGKALKATEKKMQYMPRELYAGGNPPYRLKGGILAKRQVIAVTSLMRNGMVFVDGTHVHLKFPFNTTLTVSLSPDPIKVIKA